MLSKSLILPLAVAAASMAAPALADLKGGDLKIRVGAAYMELDDNVLSDSAVFSVPDPADPEDSTVDLFVDADLDLDDDTSWFISGTYMVADHWALELYYANSLDLDANFNIYSSSTGYADKSRTYNLGDFETSVTSMMVNWFPVCVESWIQPYVGVGVNYTNIDQDFLRPVVDDGVSRGGLLDFGSSFGWTAQLGVDIELGRDSNWLVNASAMYIDADPEIELGFNSTDIVNGATVPVRIKNDMSYDSWIFNLGVGYKFSF